jgi:hypothetical protein
VAWDSLVEAANHGHPHAFQVAVTVVLEQLKREQPKKQRKDCIILSLLTPGLLLPASSKSRSPGLLDVNLQEAFVM